MSKKKIIKYFILTLISFLLFYTYYYLPNKYSKIIKIEDKIKDLKVSEIEKQNSKNIFTNTEYKSQNNKGQIYTTKAKESYIYQNQPDIIHLINPYSFTILEKDRSLIEIKSETGTFNKIKKETYYNKNVIIKNKNYLITAQSAKHYSEQNKIYINGNVIMKDLTMGLSHIAYCDIIEIDTLTNNAIAYMNSEYSQVVAKKVK